MKTSIRTALLTTFALAAFPAFAEPEWTQISDADGVKTFQRTVENTQIVAFRGETEVDAPIERVAAILENIPHRKEWIDDLIEAKNIQTISTLERVHYNYSHVSWPFQDRDLVIHVKVDVNQKDRELKIAMNDTEHPDMPPRPGVVRARLLPSKYFVKELAPNKTFLSIEVAVDPKGNVPLWLVRLKQRKWPRKTLLAFKKFATEFKGPIPPEFEEFTKGK